MRRLSKVAYWAAGSLGIAAWTSAIIALSGQPLPTQLALCGMAVMACLWGQAVLFPKQVGTSAPPARPARPLPLGRARTPTRQLPRNPAFDLPPGELPSLLREPFEEAARMEAHRLAEAISAGGLFGLVNVRLQPDGTALVAPVRVEASVQISTATLVALAHRLTCEPDPTSVQAAGRWPGTRLGAAIAAQMSAGQGTDPARHPPARRLLIKT